MKNYQYKVIEAPSTSELENRLFDKAKAGWRVKAMSQFISRSTSMASFVVILEREIKEK